MTDEKLSLDPNPFKTPIYSAQGDDSGLDLFSAVGFALTQWEQAETVLAGLFSILMHPTSRTVIPTRAFGSIFSSGTRREVIEHTVDAYFTVLLADCDQKIKDEGEALHREIDAFLRLFSDASRRRDEITHGVVHSEALLSVTILPKFFLYPALYATKKIEAFMPFKAHYRFNSADLYKYAKLFSLLSLRGGEINAKLMAFYLALPEIVRARHP